MNGLTPCPTCGWLMRDASKPCAQCAERAEEARKAEDLRKIEMARKEMQERPEVPVAPKLIHRPPPPKLSEKPSQIPWVTISCCVWVLIVGLFGPRQWAVIGMLDDDVYSRLTDLSTDGWMVVSARRCVDDILDSDPEAGYEMIAWRNEVTQNSRTLIWALLVLFVVERLGRRYLRDKWEEQNG